MREERYLVRLSLGLLIVLVLLLLLPYFIPWHWWHCGPCFWGPWPWKGLWFLVLLVIILVIAVKP